MRRIVLLMLLALLVACGDEAGPAEIPGLAPVPASAGGNDEAAGRELSAALGFFLHIEKFSARIKGKIANRIIIKGGKGFKCGCSKNKCFFHAMTDIFRLWE